MPALPSLSVVSIFRGQQLQGLFCHTQACREAKAQRNGLLLPSDDILVSESAIAQSLRGGPFVCARDAANI
jgi:hypothetical protein